MSFVSIEYGKYNRSSGQWEYTLTDSEFGLVKGIFDVYLNHGLRSGAIVVKVYSERNLNVGKNLALLSIWFGNSNPNHSSIANFVGSSDIHCPAYIPNWAEYAKERDEYLQKLLALL